jgi:hypothetical protein
MLTVLTLKLWLVNDFWRVALRRCDPLTLTLTDLTLTLLTDLTAEYFSWLLLGDWAGGAGDWKVDLEIQTKSKYLRLKWSREDIIQIFLDNVELSKQ